jgi:hypothetical protein
VENNWNPRWLKDCITVFSIHGYVKTGVIIHRKNRKFKVASANFNGHVTILITASGNNNYLE